MEVKSKLMDAVALSRALKRLSHEIIEKNKGVEDLCLLGILRRGEPLAKLLQENIRQIEGVSVPCASVDIGFYRDDLEKLADSPIIRDSDIPLELEGKVVVLVDDVLYTGRTVRAAIDAVFAKGRPRAVQLAVLIDRGHRELPIRADFVGKNVPTSNREIIEVRLPEYDGESGVYLLSV